MDVLSGGESDAGDTLNRRNNNNNSISSNVKRAGAGNRRRGSDVLYYAARELLMTERTYKRDLELVTVTWCGRVSSLGGEGSCPEAAGPLARGCLALEPLALAQGALLARLERLNTSPPEHENEEPEYKKVPQLLQDYICNTYKEYSRYVSGAAACVAAVESVRRRARPAAAAAAAAAAFDTTAPLPLAALLLRPLHRLAAYRTHLHELTSQSESKEAAVARDLMEQLTVAATEQLRHAENHAVLCQLQREIAGYDKLLVPEREFIRLGCVYKHSSKGLQQRMLFLFNDVLLVALKGGAGGQFRVHSALALDGLQLTPSELPHSFTITSEDSNVLLSASNNQEYTGWCDAIQDAIHNAKLNPKTVDTDVVPCDQNTETSGSNVSSAGGGNVFTHVCWHRVTSLSRDHLHEAMATQLSGYLLRKFKNSHGWQKLWVVFAAFTLFFYKSWEDETPLTSLPLLGYRVGAPSAEDGVSKEFVFKLQFKSHVYFFRADNHYTYNRWVEVLQTVMVHTNQNDNN